MSRDIEVGELRTLSVSADGSAFRIGLVDGDGGDVGLMFPSDALRTLMLSLFRVGDTAFKRLLNDESARLVYQAESVRLQAAPGSDLSILVLRTPDGFEAAFALDPKALTALAAGAKDETVKRMAPLRLN